jgi:hypothetical protein
MERLQPPPWLHDACPVPVIGPTCTFLCSRLLPAPLVLPDQSLSQLMTPPFNPAEAGPSWDDRAAELPTRLADRRHREPMAPPLLCATDDTGWPLHAAAHMPPMPTDATSVARLASANRDPWSLRACLSLLVPELLTMPRPRLYSTRQHPLRCLLPLRPRASTGEALPPNVANAGCGGWRCGLRASAFDAFRRRTCCTDGRHCCAPWA